MRPHQQPDIHATGSDRFPDRQAQVLAAAQALRAWVREQRETWPTLPAVPAPKTAAPAAGRAAPMFAAFSSPKHAAAVVDAPALADPGPSRWEELKEPLLKWGGRVAVGVAVLGIVATAGVQLRNHWPARRAPAPKMGFAVLESVPSESDLFIDGSAAGKTPLSVSLAAGRHVVEFRRHNTSRKLNVDVVAGKSTTERLDWTAKRKGSLEVLSDPAGASITVDDVPRGVTPMTIDDLSIGMHTVVLQRSSGSLTRTVEVRPDRVAQVTEAIYSGWLHVSTPIELQITEGARRIALDDRNQILLPPGQHDLLFENSGFGFHERRKIEVKPGAITSVAIEPPPSRLTVNASLPGEVLIDGVRAGETPLANHPIDIGTRAVVVKSITGAERRFTLTVTVNPVTLDVDFSKP